MIEENLKYIHDSIASACVRSGRRRQDVTLVAVTKTFSSSEVEKALTAGISGIGENKIQEAEGKFKELGARLSGIQRHFLGHLQTNKAKKAVELFDVIQSLDSLKLAREIDKCAAAAGKAQDCLIELKVSGEETKFGVSEHDIFDFAAQLAEFENINVRGMMTMAPYFEDKSLSRPYFKLAKQVFDRFLEKRLNNFRILSMGMSADFEVAIEEGSNMVRIGTAIFGERASGMKLTPKNMKIP
jgi:hypothetical protein